ADAFVFPPQAIPPTARSAMTPEARPKGGRLREGPRPEVRPKGDRQPEGPRTERTVPIVRGRRYSIAMETRSEDAPIYSDRTTGQVFASARAMVDAYLKRFSERSGAELHPLDENGYTQTRKGSASIGVN